MASSDQTSAQDISILKEKLLQDKLMKIMSYSQKKKKRKKKKDKDQKQSEEVEISPDLGKSVVYNKILCI